MAGLVTFAFAQKKVVKSAERNFKKGELEVAMSEINDALQNPETMDESNTVMVRGKIQTKMFILDEDMTATTVELGRGAFNDFTKAIEMEGGDQDSKIGKEIFKDDLPDLPENFKPYNMMSLRMEAYNKAAQAYEDDDYEMAYEFFHLAADIDPTDTSATFNAGYLANEVGKNEEAKELFGRLLENPDYNKLTTYYLMIQMALNDQDTEGAYKYVVSAKKDYPEDKTLSEFEVQLLLQLDRMDEALASVKEALEDDPNNSGMLLRYGFLLEQSGDIEGALEQYKNSVKADPNDFDANYYTGALYLEKANKIYTEVNNLSDEDWEKYAESMTEEANGLYKDAIPYFTSAMEARPENTDILEVLFRVHSRLKNTDEAEKINQKLISILGEDWLER